MKARRAFIFQHTVVARSLTHKMYVIVCRESGLDCDFIIRGDTKEEFLKNGADHAIEQHGMNANDIYLNDTPTNLLCHSFNEES